ncbi:ABC-2 family transporter protein [Paenibacillus sp. HN-1]|uniref:ABC transporter permease n=1 Tax=Paenibacillus TaxID=44249 RepID=UPI001CA94B4E|nr:MULTISPECIES: ABC-2 family transporter protein [Paenibacillus]MBY9080747.1 ABC-2 family transporter protein [Paenibacillus sp. CGMCC 1.18879]MBY9085261.1 ABC-2 family transporter protein [Paenibacillus sinensis]
MYEFQKHSFKDYVSLYFRFLKLTVSSRMQYKTDTYLLTFAVIIRECTALVSLYLILMKFSQIQSWNIAQLLFLYSFVFLTYSLCILLFTGIRDFESLIHHGEFDGYLTKPIAPFFHVIARKSDIMATLGHGTLGVLLFVYAYHKLNLPLSAGNILAIVLVMTGGILIQGALLLFTAVLTFWTVKSSGIQDLLFYQMRSFIAYPLSIYPKYIQGILTFIVPLGFVNYYPSRFFMGDHSNWGWVYLTLGVGVILFAAALLFWRTGLQRYESSGN